VFETLIVTCALIAWEPAQGAETYDVHAGGAIAATVSDPSYQVCRPFLYAPYEVYVVGRDASGNVGPPSDPLTLVWHLNADVDGDGVVGFSDVGVLGKEWRHCHDDLKEIPCPP